MNDDLWGAASPAYSNGTTSVCAAGSNWFADKLVGAVKPAEYQETIAVGGIEPRTVRGETRHLPWREGYDGPQVDISAPAKFVHMAYKRRGRLQLGEDVYKFGGGTSKSTVNVAAALWKYTFRTQLGDEWDSEVVNKHR